MTTDNDPATEAARQFAKLFEQENEEMHQAAAAKLAGMLDQTTRLAGPGRPLAVALLRVMEVVNEWSAPRETDQIPLIETTAAADRILSAIESALLAG